ncbi:hypothetical protein [uncultured Roseibium sp.]|nr:hypothetical protein [uncultured Roseibium sp.]
MFPLVSDTVLLALCLPILAIALVFGVYFLMRLNQGDDISNQ